MIEYIKGDLFDYVKPNENTLIAHIVNDVGVWGSGFVIPLGNRFPKAREVYLAEHYPFSQICTEMLGHNGIVDVGDCTYVANMFAQAGIMSHSTGDRSKVNNKPIRYSALVKCMEDLSELQKEWGFKIYAPAFGSDRSGGNWGMINELIEEIWAEIEVKIFYLDRNQQTNMEKNIDFKLP